MKAAIVGAGPAGLLASQALKSQGVDHFLLEAGAIHPRLDPIQGVGGAGLYSDGKFSFYPAGTKAWALEPREMLAESYDFISTLLRDSGISDPPIWSDSWKSSPLDSFEADVQKTYPSFYLSLDERIVLIEKLARMAPIMTASRLSSLRFRANLIDLEFTVKDAPQSETVDGLVLATGRLWEANLHHDLPTTFNRLEAGVRVQQPSDIFALKDTSAIDPKFIWRRQDPLREYRTFCVCREGEIVHAETPVGTLCSGRKGETATGKSNFGLMVRYLDQRTAPNLTLPLPFEIALSQVRKDPTSLALLVGSPLSEHLLESASLLEDWIGLTLAEAVLAGPCLEGVGVYPTTYPKTLRAPIEAPVCIAGDAAGVFRGLVPALLSGHYAGTWLAHELLTGRTPYE